MMHKCSVGVEFLCRVWVLCVLLGSIATTARSDRTFVNRALTCRGGSSATEVATTARKGLLFRRDLNDNESVDENESDDGDELIEEPKSASKKNRWWKINTDLETPGAEASSESPKGQSPHELSPTELRDESEISNDSTDDGDTSVSSKRKMLGTSRWSRSSSSSDLHNSTDDTLNLVMEESSVPLDATTDTTPRNNGWKMLGKFCGSGCYRCSPSALFEASQRYDEQKQRLSVDHPGAYMNHTDTDTAWYNLDASNGGFPPATDDDMEDDDDSQLGSEVGGQEPPSATFDQRATDVDERDASENAERLEASQTEADLLVEDTDSGNSTLIASNSTQTSVPPVPPLDTVPTGVNGTASANANGTNMTVDARNAAMLYLLQQQLQQQQQAAAGTPMYGGTPMYVYRPNGNMPLSPQQQQPSSNHSTELILAVMPLLRIGFLSYLTHRARHRINLEEQGGGSSTAAVIQPSQHYAFEVLNRRYEIDHLALQRAMDVADDVILDTERMGLSPREQKKAQAAKKQMEKKNPGAATPYLFGSVTPPPSRKPSIWRRKLRAKSTKPALKSVSQPPKPKPTKTVVILQFGSRGGLMTPEEPSTPTSASGGATSLPTNLEELRDSISFLVSQYQPPNHKNMNDSDDEDSDANTTQQSELEIILLLESPGGSASYYGLAAAQLSRLRNLPATLTICVDQVAASGGYMMACLASPDKLYASPFASVGSIGVITSLLNYRKGLQQKLGIEPIVVKAGKDKNILSDTAEVTKEGLKLVQEDLDRVHTAFCTHVAENRLVLHDNTTDTEENPITSQPSFSGRVWIGRDAMKMGLVDRIISSDDYIGELLQSKETIRVLRLYKYRPKAYRSMWGGGGNSNSMWDYFTKYKGTVMQLGTSLFGITAVRAAMGGLSAVMKCATDNDNVYGGGRPGMFQAQAEPWSHLYPHSSPGY